MDLRFWRTSREPKLTLAQAAPLFGISRSSLSEIELGEADVSRETIARIEGVTGGQVRARDLFEAYQDAPGSTFKIHRAAGRRAMASYRKTAKKPRK